MLVSGQVIDARVFSLCRVHIDLACTMEGGAAVEVKFEADHVMSGVP